jgi:hypothetical protein
MATIYTHRLKLEAGTININTKVEFNIDGRASFERLVNAEGLTLEQSERISALLAELKRIHDVCGSITKIELLPLP